VEFQLGNCTKNKRFYMIMHKSSKRTIEKETSYSRIKEAPIGCFGWCN